MFSPTVSTERHVTARLGLSPHYTGSSHDPEVARKLGYRGALIPGAFLYGYMGQQALDAWGMDWVERGTIQTRFRRPAFDGDVLTVRAAPLRLTEHGSDVDMTICGTDGTVLATGAVGLPDRPAPVPDLSAYPLVQVNEGDAKRVIGGGALTEGTRLGTRGLVLTAEALAKSLDDFGETFEPYREQGIVHSGLLLRTGMGEAYAAFAFPTPVILVEAETQHLGTVRVGDRITSSGQVTRVYEHKGNHYFDSEQLLIANGRTPVARQRRAHIYAARTAA